MAVGQRSLVRSATADVSALADAAGARGAVLFHTGVRPCQSVPTISANSRSISESSGLYPSLSALPGGSLECSQSQDRSKGYCRRLAWPPPEPWGFPCRSRPNSTASRYSVPSPAPVRFRPDRYASGFHKPSGIFDAESGRFLSPPLVPTPLSRSLDSSPDCSSPYSSNPRLAQVPAAVSGASLFQARLSNVEPATQAIFGKMAPRFPKRTSLNSARPSSPARSWSRIRSLLSNIVLFADEGCSAFRAGANRRLGVRASGHRHRFHHPGALRIGSPPERRTSATAVRHHRRRRKNALDVARFYRYIPTPCASAA